MKEERSHRQIEYCTSKYQDNLLDLSTAYNRDTKNHVKLP